MSYFDQREDSILVLDDSLLNLYDEQFEYSSFKSLISNAQFKKIVALSNLIQRIYHNDIRNMPP